MPPAPFRAGFLKLHEERQRRSTGRIRPGHVLRGLAVSQKLSVIHISDTQSNLFAIAWVELNHRSPSLSRVHSHLSSSHVNGDLH